jgi:hypothetical protein
VSEAARKITVQLPGDLIDKAMASTGQSLTATVRKGLEVLAASRAYAELRKLRGKVRLNLELKESRKDR